MNKVIAGLIAGLLMSLGHAAEAVQPLLPSKAFIFSAYVNEQNKLFFQWNIAPGYYLYQNKVKVTVLPTDKVKIGQIQWPAAVEKKRHDGASYSIYSGVLKVALPLVEERNGVVTFVADYQGCSSNGFCYAPIKKYLRVDLSTLQAGKSLTQYEAVAASSQSLASDQAIAQTLFAQHGVVFVLLSFLGLGLLLAFTPCVLPMIPILSGIIIGHRHQVKTMRAFSLSLAYVVGMASTYALAGMLVAVLGSSIQVFFQKLWVIGLFSVIFVLLAFSLFGFYEIQLPNHWHRHATKWSNRLTGGSYVSVFFMGCLSTLIVSPCVSAPLVGVLTYIAQTGNMLFGGAALLMLGIGMGVPLLAIGASAGKWLPKAGNWMELIKKLFGILMLAIAIWMLSRVVSVTIILILWSFLLIGTGIFIIYYHKKTYRMFFRLIGGAIILAGVFVLLEPVNDIVTKLFQRDSTDLLARKSELPSFFILIKNQSELEQQIKLARENKKLVAIDFYAQWCVSCVLMDKQLFNQADVRATMADFVRLRVDVTENTKIDQAIMKYYHVVAPPTILFFNPLDHDETSQRLVGEVNKAQFLTTINNIKEKLDAK